MAYDPYGGQTPEQQLGFGDIAREIVNPANLLVPYAIDPRSFSNTKGIWTPFETRGSAWKKAFGSFRETKYGPYIGGLSKAGNFNIMKGMKSVGGLVNPFADYRRGVGNIESIGNLKNKNIERWSRLDRTTALETKYKNLFNKQRGHVRTKWNDGGYIGDELGFKAARLKEHAYHKQWKRIEKANTPYIENTLNKITKTESIIKNKKLLKWGIRGARTASAIGLAMFAWDIGAMAARPIGQAVMGTINNVAMEYQNRFMPEMGGQLQLSYLSQGAATERQRAIQSISKSYINGRSAFGSEGSLMHS